MQEEFQMRVNAEGVVSILRANLTALYTDRFCIIQEMLQNADDAKAKHVHFGVSGPLDVDHPLGKLKALFIINDGPVSRSNMQSIYTVASGDKGDAGDKIGKFGLGMKSVFHLCEGFFMFGEGLESDLTFPYFCTPWTSEYQPEWHEQWPGAKAQMAAAVKKAIGKHVEGWDRWFCVWLPLREESMHAGDRTKPIIQEYPEDCDIDVITGRDYASSAAKMLPLLRTVEHLSFSDRTGSGIRFVLESSGRLTGDTGDLRGRMSVAEGELEPYEFIGEEKKIKSDDFKKLQSLRIWPMSTRFVSDGPARGLRSYPDKTDSHVAVCIIKEKSDNPSLSVVPCMNLPLGIVRKSPGEHIKKGIGGKHSVTVELHGCFFVDPARINFKMGEVPCYNPSSETGLCEEWNRRLFFNGVLPLVVPGLYNAIQEQKWDEETISCVMRAIGEVPYLREKMDDVCRTQGIVRVLGRCKGEDRWVKVDINDSIKVYAIEPPRSDKVRAVIADALEANEYVIDASAGRLFPRSPIKTKFSPELCRRFLSVIAAKPIEETDNEVLRQFAQECAAGVMDFALMPEEIKKAKIWKVGNGRASYEEIKELLASCKIYCHAEGGLKKTFQDAVKWDMCQITEPLKDALKLDVPDFTYEFVLDVLQKMPDLSEPEERCRLLRDLLGVMRLRDLPKWKQGCRYLVHGMKALFNSEDPLFIPLNGDYARISEKIINALARHKWGTRCELPSAIVRLLSGKDQEDLKLPFSSPKRLVIEFSTLTSISSEDISDDDWQDIVLMASGVMHSEDVEDAVKKLAIFPVVGGGRTAVTKDVFYEDGFKVPSLLQSKVTLVEVSEESRPYQLLRKLVTKWNPNDCVRVALKSNLVIADLSDILKMAFWEDFELSGDVKDALANKQWVELVDGSLARPSDIISLEGFSDKIPGCISIDCVSDPELRSLLSRHRLILLRFASLEKMFGLMEAASDGRFRLGRIDALKNKDDLTPLVDALGTESEIPAVVILRKLREMNVSFAHVAELQEKLHGELAEEHIRPVLNLLTEAVRSSKDEGRKDVLLSFLCAYLDDFSSRNDFVSDIVPDVRFFNRRGDLKSSKELCVGTEGVPDKYILSNVYENAPRFRDEIKSTVLAKQEKVKDRHISFAEYFRGWDQEFDERIGSFIISCSDQAADLDIVKRRYGFEHRSIEEAREGLAKGLHWFLKNQHCYVLATDAQGVDVISISGDKMSVRMSPLAGANDLFFGQYNACEYVRNSALSHSMGNPPQPPEDHSVFLQLRKLSDSQLHDVQSAKLDLLLKNTLIKILLQYGLQGRERAQSCGYTWVNSGVAFDQYWEVLKHSEQLAVKVTKSIILQSLNIYLPMLNCRHDRLKEKFGEWIDLQTYEMEADLNGRLSHAEKYRKDRSDLQRRLEECIVGDPDIQASILKALRSKMQEHYQYDVNSILFELFQNADDAAEELCQMYGADVPELPNRYSVRFDGDNLVIVHWGRPINQSKVGADSDPRYETFRMDLQKMLMLSQSGKGIEGMNQVGKFGLGFKTVFFVSDTPFVSSGKLRFKIVGGLLPEPLSEDEDAVMREVESEFHEVSEVINPTVYVLPVLPQMAEHVKRAIHVFKEQIAVLSLFSRRIKTLDVKSVDGVVHSSTEADQSKLFVLDLGVGQMLMAKTGGGLPEGLPKDVSTYWATSPTQMKVDLGIAVNANFDLDTGRSYLNTKSERNRDLTKKLAEKLFGYLADTHSALSSEECHEWFSSFYRSLFVDRMKNWRCEENNALARVFQEIFWNVEYGAFRRLSFEKAVIPSMLPGDYDVLCRSDEIMAMIDSELLEYDLTSLLSVKYPVGAVVAKQAFNGVGAAFFPERVKDIKLYRLHDLIEDLKKDRQSLTPEWVATSEGAKFAKAVLEKKDDEDLNIQKSMMGFLFKTKSGTFRSAEKMFVPDNRSCSDYRVGFIPCDRVLSMEYSDDGVELFKISRGNQILLPAELAAFALGANTDAAQGSVLRYLASKKDHSKDFIESLITGKFGTWLHQWETVPAANGLSKRDRNAIIDVLTTGDDTAYEIEMQKSSGHPEKRIPVKEVELGKVYEWWQQNYAKQLKKYNCEVYGKEDVNELRFETETSRLDNVSRSDWLEVLLLGAAHSLGLKISQHKGFIRWLKDNDFWKVYCEAEIRPEKWLETLDHILDYEEVKQGRYSHWMKLFFRIYQFAHHLDAYLAIFESWNFVDECEKNDLAAIKTNPKLSGSGIDVPGLQYALNNTGLHFVCREMVRRNAIKNRALHPFCFVPYPDVAELTWNIRNSKKIYDKVVREIGEDAADFNGAFDIAILQYLKNRQELLDVF